MASWTIPCTRNFMTKDLVFISSSARLQRVLSKLQLVNFKPNTMKTFKTPVLSAVLTFSLCAGMLTFSACHSDDTEDIDDKDACEQLECLNRGNAIKDVELGGCRCICPAGYSGTNCETKNQ